MLNETLISKLDRSVIGGDISNVEVDDIVSNKIKNNKKLTKKDQCTLIYGVVKCCNAKEGISHHELVKQVIARYKSLITFDVDELI